MKRLTPGQEKAIADRVARAKPRRLSQDWHKAAVQFAKANGHEPRYVLDVFEEQAAILVYCGAAWVEAQVAAWTETVALLTRAA